MERGPNDDRWRERPLLGAALQGLLTIAPLVVGIAVGVSVSRFVLAGRIEDSLSSWAIAGSSAMLTVWALQPLVRRIVPLAWLLKLGMLWPGQAPSRYKIARRSGRVRDLEDRLANAREHGLQGDAQQAAELVLSLMAALTSHDRRTRGHAERVRVFADLLALEVDLSRDDRDRLRWSALLHDIGKLKVPGRVLNKPGKPSPREWEQLKSHPEAGHRILAPLREWLGEWADATLHHHERWDGNGYPQGLAAHDISRAGRLVAVADSYEVMTSARAYKRPMGAAAAREELVACAGRQFDPAIVRSFLFIPIWRLRWALGPFAWVAQLPLARDVVHAGSSMGAAAPAAGAAAGATAVIVGSSLYPAVDFSGGVAANAFDTGAQEHDSPAGQHTNAEKPAGPTADDPDHVAQGSVTAEPSPDADPGLPANGTADPRDDNKELVDDTTDETSDAVTDTVDDTTEAVTDTVDDTTEAVTDTVDDTTEAVADTDDDTTEAVDDVLTGLE